MFWILLIQTGVMCGVIFYIVRRTRRANGLSKPAGPKQQNVKELQKLAALRARSLSMPLSETARPGSFSELIGQEEGVLALRAALCGPNPQHVLLYGPPGVGKTCAARLVLEEAKKSVDSPFNSESQFVEIDATCVRFDERAIADPLIGSVHDPIYQGAGALGQRGIPQPKPGAVTRAHCGILFLDEIGELHPMQMNKLLKVLEDRRVRFESAYYSEDDTNIPEHIHDIFRNGLPADFRLVGATTRAPEELPSALRSRCIELHFSTLSQNDLARIAENAALRAGYQAEDGACTLAAHYSRSGRDAVNIIQLGAGLAHNDARKEIRREDVLWIARTCNYAPCLSQHMENAGAVGRTYLLAVSGQGDTGIALELECTAAHPGKGMLTLCGIVEEEELTVGGRKLRRKSTARASVENVVYAVTARLGVSASDYDIRFNIPGGLPADGPSAGVALSVALCSALTEVCPVARMAATGEITIGGEVRPVGGVRRKVLAAIEAGAQLVLIPAENDDPELHTLCVPVKTVRDLTDVFSYAFAQEVYADVKLTTPCTDCTI